MMFNGSTLGHVNKTNLDNYEIAIQEISTVKIYLDYLGAANQTLQTLQTLQIQKEASICGKIKLLTTIGTSEIDYDKYTFSECVEYQKKSIKYKAADGKQIGKYKFYTSSQTNIMYIDDEPMYKEIMLTMGRNGDTNVHYDNIFSCEHDHVYVMKVLKPHMITKYKLDDFIFMDKLRTDISNTYQINVRK